MYIPICYFVYSGVFFSIFSNVSNILVLSAAHNIAFAVYSAIEFGAIRSISVSAYMRCSSFASDSHFFSFFSSSVFAAVFISSAIRSASYASASFRN